MNNENVFKKWSVQRFGIDGHNLPLNGRVHFFRCTDPTDRVTNLRLSGHLSGSSSALRYIKLELNPLNPLNQLNAFDLRMWRETLLRCSINREDPMVNLVGEFLQQENKMIAFPFPIKVDAGSILELSLESAPAESLGLPTQAHFYTPCEARITLGLQKIDRC